MEISRKKFIQDLSEKTNWREILIYFSASYVISNRFSPYFSYHFIKKDTSPNKITMYMIVSGVLGGIFFMIPNVWCKVVGAILIQLWFIFDCSDGEVARYTKNFSKYGSELDFLAHLIDHPFFCVAFALSLLQLKTYNTFFVLFVVFSCLFLDSYMRNLVTLEKYTSEDIREKKVQTNMSSKLSIVDTTKIIFNTFLFFPNVVLFGVLVYFVDYFFHTPLLMVLLIGNLFCSGLVILLKLKRKLFQFYHS